MLHCPVVCSHHGTLLTPAIWHPPARGQRRPQLHGRQHHLGGPWRHATEVRGEADGDPDEDPPLQPERPRHLRLCDSAQIQLQRSQLLLQR